MKAAAIALVALAALAGCEVVGGAALAPSVAPKPATSVTLSAGMKKQSLRVTMGTGVYR